MAENCLFFVDSQISGMMDATVKIDSNSYYQISHFHYWGIKLEKLKNM